MTLLCTMAISLKAQNNFPSTGNVAIGTPSAITALDANSTVAGVARFNTTATGNTSNVVISNNSNWNYGVMGVTSGTGAANGDIFGLGYISNPNASFNPVLNWTSTGNVGIGSTSPGSTLEVGGVITTKLSHVDGITNRIWNTLTGNSLTSYSTGTSAYGIPSWINSGVIEHDNNLVFDAFAGSISLQTARSTGLFLKNDGYVGIGTTTPNALLNLNGPLNGNSSLTFGIPGTSGNTAVPLGNMTGGYNIDFHTWRDVVTDQIGARIRAERINNYQPNNALVQSMDLAFYTSDGWLPQDLTEQLRIKSGGNVGIGTINPQSLLQVDDGCTKASIGDASGAGLNYGTSYLGFNASRIGTNWNLSNDGQHNGGGVIYSNILGEVYFAPIASTGTTDQTLSDTDIKNKITFRVSADGITYAKKIKVELGNWPDYVFAPKYVLTPLSEVKNYIDKNHHLPDMPSAEQVEKNGLDLGEMNKQLVKKMEELTLYLLQQQKEIDALKQQIKRTNK